MASSSKKSKKRGKKDNWRVDSGVRTEIRGLLTLALSVLLALALYHPSSGALGGVLRVFMTSLLGRAAWILPLLVALTGVAWMVQIKPGSVIPRVVGLGLAGLTAAGFYQATTTSLPPFEPALVRSGGGYLGAAITWALTAAFGPVGRTLLLFVGAFVAALLLINVPAREMASTLFGGISGFVTRIFSGTTETGKGSSAKAGDSLRDRNDSRDRQVAIRTYPEDVEGETDSGRAEESAESSPENAREESEPKIISSRADGNGKAGGTDSKSAETRDDSLPVGAEVAAAQPDASYRLPSAGLLSRSGGARGLGDGARSELNRKARLLESTLADFGIKARVMEISHGPSVTRFDLQPGPGVKVSQIVSLSDDIALSMATTGVRVVAPVPGKSAVGIEVPNREIAAVSLREIVESREFRREESLLSVALGADITGKPMVVKLEDLLHVLIAGATGSGKSISIRCIIASILMKARPDQVKLLLVDPKVVEFMTYDGLPHLLAPVVTDAKKAAGCLTWAVKEMERRYRHFAEHGVRDLPAYNRKAAEKGESLIPRIVIIIDELADLMMVARVDVEDAIQRLAQMARAAGIHLVVATQRPSVDVITGVIKANIPSRIAFAVSSSADSRTILDSGGAEKLLGHGDMLFSPVGRDRAIRAQGSFLSDEDVERLLDFVRAQGEPEYREEVIESVESESSTADGGDETDPKLPDAVDVVMEAGEASVSMLQRRLRVGYTRAGRMMDTMENLGIVGPYQGSKPREVLMTRSQYLARWGEEDESEGEGEEA
ncbi:MAG: DNA translocase FtsK 4TM domain-containing protein [Bacillota bacterium]